MPLQAFTWAASAPIDDATTFRVLLVLVDHCDDSGLAFPLVSTLAARTHKSDATVRRHLEVLEAAGYIERLRLRKGGKMRGYLYRVLFPGAEPVVSDCLPRFVAADTELPSGWASEVSTAHPLAVAGGPSTAHLQAVDPRSPVSGQEPPTFEPPTEPSTLVVADAPTAGPSFDDDFWPAYRHTVKGRPTGAGNKQPARKTWDKLTPDDRQAAVDALPDLGRLLTLRDKAPGRRDPWPSQHASTWLNQRGWQDVADQLEDLSASPSAVANGPPARDDPMAARLAAMFDDTGETA